MAETLLDILLDAVIDTAKLLPFLFLTYLGMEYLEHKMTTKNLIWVQRAGNLGPAIGGFLGMFPQCGFSAAAAGLYAGRVISLGTLIAIFLSTSDEMLPLFISEKMNPGLIAGILLSKAAIGIVWGFLTDFVFFRNENASEHIHIHSLCEQEHCNCEKGIFKSALKHTLHIALFIFIVSLVLAGILEFAGMEFLTGTVLNKPVIGPMIMSLVGLIPNCAASVAITELYLGGVIGMGSLMAGLLTNAGVGWIILLRSGHSVKRTLKVIGLTYVFGIVSGILIQLFLG